MRAHAKVAEVIGTAREANHDHLARLGAVPVTDGDGLADRARAVAPHGVDAALDAVGGRALADALALVDAHRDVGSGHGTGKVVVDLRGAG